MASAKSDTKFLHFAAVRYRCQPEEKVHLQLNSDVSVRAPGLAESKPALTTFRKRQSGGSFHNRHPAIACKVAIRHNAIPPT